MNKTIDKRKEKGKDVSSQQKDVDNLTTDIGNLNNSKTEIGKMGDTKDKTFTFKFNSGSVGGAKINEKTGVIELTISGNGSIANGIHESTHGYDIWKNGGNTTSNWNSREIKAYSRQFSYNKNSLPNSYFGTVNSLQDITKNWVYGAYDSSGGTKKYLYVHYLLQGVERTNTEIEEWLEGLPK